MAGYNKVILMGNLTRDPELRYTPAGTAVANLRLAVNRRYRDRNQEMKEEVCFVTAVVWNKQAETCNQYLHKGSGVLVEGRLQSRSWEDQASGKTRSVLEVRAERVQFVGGPGKGAAAAGPAEEPAQEPGPEADWSDENEEKLNEA